MKKWLYIAPVAGALGIGAGIGADQLLSAAAPGDAKQDVKPAVTLPITRVVLFNSGVGYFSRSGEVADDARVDLTFPEQDINDLLKSMVLEDFNGGRIAAVSYDSREPIARTLSSFAINLNDNPTFAGILSQMRGERVDVVLTPGAANQPGKLSGVIVGVEKAKVAAGNGPATVDVEVLNMWCAEGLRSVKLPDVQQLQFANPVIEASSAGRWKCCRSRHDSQKKSVSLHFAGDGKRKVQVGYVIEAPIWKTSYRLVLGEKEKPYLQGWAMVENPTDEDWTGVKMALDQRPADLVQDGPVQPALRESPDGRAGTVRLAAARRPIAAASARSMTGARRCGTDKPAGRCSLPLTAGARRWRCGGAGGGGMGSGGMPGGGGRLAEGRMMLARDQRQASEAERRRYARERWPRTRRAASRPARSATRRRPRRSATSSSTPSTTRSRSPARRSAMLPIVGKDVEGQKVSHLQPGRPGQAPAARASSSRTPSGCT